ncbi:glycosyltransferase [Flammeovirga sp. OC4]|uniref:glycosyltransferase n=1 Tax=Flammeovirga sp. OC4 TaxID=1382345 RepID=UPI0005C50E09|nr:glycosyltransferase [Flammeovirga sp. OC4]
MRKILFIGLAHRSDDPRLFHREIKVIKETNSCDIYWLTNREDETYENASYIDKYIKLKKSNNLIVRIIKNIFNILKTVHELKPDVIQFSDIRELIFLFPIKFFFGAKVRIIYDAHEDYFEQILVFDRNKVKAYILKYVELLSFYFIDTVFCTDDYLLEYYKKYHPKVYLMRNYPLIPKGNIIKEYWQNDNLLKLVYIGTMNPYKGVGNIIDFTNRFNNEKNDFKLELNFYTNLKEVNNDLLSSNEFIKYNDYIPLNKLYDKLKQYQVGVCIWKNIKKLERNLPIKNFDYMAVGLPVLTSNFGNLKKYIDLSKSGVCISPEDYLDFKNAVITLNDKNKRVELGNNAYNFFSEGKDFRLESDNYLDVILNF